MQCHRLATGRWLTLLVSPVDECRLLPSAQPRRVLQPGRERRLSLLEIATGIKQQEWTQSWTQSCRKRLKRDVFDFSQGNGWMDGWKEGRMEGWKDGRMEGRMDGWKDGRMDVWIDGWMYGLWMYVCMDVCMDGWMDGRISMDSLLGYCINKPVRWDSSILELS